MTNAYADLTALKVVLAELATGDNARLLALAEAASRDIENHLGRVFYTHLATRYFSGNGKTKMRLPGDLIAVTTLKEDEDRDGATFETTWATTDYELGPYHALPTGVIGGPFTMPYWWIEVNDRDNGTKSEFGKGQKRFELVGKWGYSELKRASGDTVGDNPLTAGATTLNVTSGGNFAIGQTILIESEQLYITNIVTNALTVERGVNGTTAASHVQTTAISIFEYPPPVVQVATALTSRRWMLERANYSFQLGSPEGGVVAVGGSLDLLEGEKRVLAPYIRGDVMVA